MRDSGEVGRAVFLRERNHASIILYLAPVAGDVAAPRTASQPETRPSAQHPGRRPRVRDAAGGARRSTYV
ncbi:hypothetical protein GCM10010305_41570 [Streptomyces termitum]|uniref:Uncharacterized protein n=1 Tax=Streptomyces termitum TaxID=67368 RepID=A0A918T959_9ACTN|nr:hypothetical protein GCM10010305_41570 [Streptomyces termitum]